MRGGKGYAGFVKSKGASGFAPTSSKGGAGKVSPSTVGAKRASYVQSSAPRKTK